VGKPRSARPSNALGVAVLTGAADVVHDLVGTALHERAPDARGDVVERLGWRTRKGSVTRLSVAGPLAQFLPREPGCSGFPSNFRTSSVSRSTYASSPQADSQLKQVVGTSR